MIEQLLDFIFSNLWFIIVAVWFLAPLFRREQQHRRRQEAGTEQQPQATTEEAPRKTEQPFDFPEMPDFPSFPWDQDEPEPVRPLKPEYEKREETILREKTMDDQPQQEKIDTPVNREATPPVIREGSPLYQNENQPLEVIDLDDEEDRIHTEAGLIPRREDALKGMVWSQVFGPPRSRVPHRTSRFSRLQRKRI
ncbi:MAG: hypothetical protein H0Z33_05820 [Bacillaceae bacterium]|nr:hypothetical protein [Bacillaceae bacterium]